jgi:hypothetical protein
MLTTEQINELHRLYWSERWTIRKIERHLRMGWRTIRKYLEQPAQTPLPRQRTSKLDPFKTTIAELLEKDPTASAAVIGQRLRPLGYSGCDSILRAYVHQMRPAVTQEPATEPRAGKKVKWSAAASATSDRISGPSASLSTWPT